MTLPQNTAMELLSVKLIEVVAAKSGLVCSHPDKDFGTDISVRQIEVMPRETGGLRYSFNGVQLDVQVKATHESNVTVESDVLKYDLAVDNYNDLVRREPSSLIPLYLALVVLPDAVDQWLSLGDSDVIVRKCGYLWRPEPGLGPSKNKHTQRIGIPLEGRIKAGTFESLFKELTQ